MAMLRDRPPVGTAQGGAHNRRKAPFPRILSEDFSSALQRVGGDGTGAANAGPDRPPAGAAVPPAGRCRSRRAQGHLRTDTDWSGNGLAIRLHIVY